MRLLSTLYSTSISRIVLSCTDTTPHKREDMCGFHTEKEAQPADHKRCFNTASAALHTPSR